MSGMYLVGSRMLQCAEKTYITRVYRYPKKNGGFIHTAETVLDSGDNIVSDGNTLEEALAKGQRQVPAVGAVLLGCLATRDGWHTDEYGFRKSVRNCSTARGSGIWQGLTPPLDPPEPLNHNVPAWHHRVPRSGIAAL